MEGSISAGIDLGSRKISVVYAQGSECYGVSHSQVLRDSNRAEELFKLVDLVCSDGQFPQADFYFIEEPLVGRGTRTSLQIAQTAGALLYALGNHHEREVHFVPNKTWKLHTVGNGNAGKPEVARWLAETHPDYYARCGTNQDLIDAACIAVYGTGLIERARLLGHLDDLVPRDEDPRTDSAED